MGNRNFVNLNVNPCKMCMPMGAVTAFKGIGNSMMILHGSQGCSTYIRRHMAGHYNEPVDIASSSLNEDGTVFGGEKNLKKGLMNIIKQYSPEIIGVATTCLAETIGEDIERMVQEFEKTLAEDDSEKHCSVRIIPVSTPGYGGSQFEGYHAALLSLVRTLTAEPAEKNGKLNVVVSSLNPGDVRNVRRVLDLFEADYILFPDISETLDAPYRDEYHRIPHGGTPAGHIALMAGAAATIEMGMTVDDRYSCGKYLSDTFGVPLYKCAIPIGIENSDHFIGLISKITGKPVPEALQKERGRFIDAMIDSHKYNGEGRAVIFGEPELVLALTGLCAENGIRPVLVGTGSKNEKLEELIAARIIGEKPVILDDIDFETIRERAVELKANILIGNSDGKFITEKEGIPLVRTGFPIHDRVGGQRWLSTLYDGSVRLLDEITNTLLDEKFSTYRQRMHENIYIELYGRKEATQTEADKKALTAKRTEEHPCFGKGACSNARMHIPVAPACNISCNYCNRKYDCMNESRPGVTSEVLSPAEAAEKFKRVRSRVKNLKVVGIAGPGDALANFAQTREALKKIREIDPDITFCLSTNGLMLPYFAHELAELGVTHVTVTVNAVDPKVSAKIYGEINFMGIRLTGEDGCRILLRNQLAGLKQLASMGIVCKVNIVMIKGINDEHIEEVVKAVKECGVYMTNIMPLIPAGGSVFENFPQTSGKEVNEMRRRCGAELRQMYHCRQCRADAVGTLDQDICHEFGRSKAQETERPEAPARGRELRFAVATQSGVLVDQHFGHCEEFHIYRWDDEGAHLEDRRRVDKYCRGIYDCGDEASRMEKIVEMISDCSAVLALRIGHNPAKLLGVRGIAVIQTCGRIEDCLKDAVESVKEAAVCCP